jgi:hypothetical protein
LEVVTLGRVVAVAFALAAAVNALMFLAAPGFLQDIANEGSRQSREGDYRLDLFRPYRWLLETWPRRLAWVIFGLALSAWLCLAYFSN